MDSCSPNVVKSESKEKLHANFRLFLINELNKASSANRDKMIIGVSGGSMPNLVCEVLKTIEAKDVVFPLGKVHFFACDERIVPVGHADSNTGAYLNLLPDEMKRNFLPFVYHDDARRCAEEYEKELKVWNPPMSNEWPQFDLLLLGMGPDGHTCSLFPGHALLKERSVWIAPIVDSPKPPPRRITITFPVIRKAKTVAVIATGAGKASVIKDCLENRVSRYPAATASDRPNVTWFVDSESGKLLNN